VRSRPRPDNTFSQVHARFNGRDPNSFAGVAWCFGKHDRPWSPRPVFGTVRYMNVAGLRRKFDIDAYVRKVNRLGRANTSPGCATALE